MSGRVEIMNKSELFKKAHVMTKEVLANIVADYRVTFSACLKTLYIMDSLMPWESDDSEPVILTHDDLVYLYKNDIAILGKANNGSSYIEVFYNSDFFKTCLNKTLVIMSDKNPKMVLKSLSFNGVGKTFGAFKTGNNNDNIIQKVRIYYSN